MTATGPFKVTLGHRPCYRLKAHMDLLVNNTTLYPLSNRPFPSYRSDAYWSNYRFDS